MTAITSFSSSNAMAMAVGSVASSPLYSTLRSVPETTIPVTELSKLYEEYTTSIDEKELAALKTIEQKAGEKNPLAYVFGSVIDHFQSKMALLQTMTGKTIADLEKNNDQETITALKVIRGWLQECVTLSSKNTSEIFDSVYNDYVNYCLL